MQYTTIDEKVFLIRLEKGEELIETLTGFAKQQNLGFASFSGLGAVENPTLAFYNLDEKKYEQKSFPGHFEVANLLGNVSTFKEQKIIHCHTTLGNKDFGTIAGHLQSASCAATLEVVMKVYTPKIDRKRSHDIGLNLLELGNNDESSKSV